ncbi:hypothetical protein EV44_g3119 [Erysiphe necator]|uniref:Uncharacterized protein n=1 Tax=Uncinula necator TaxID=52586 RepID=A0A0B1P6S7_UNCNE|nr:hypothetical protein EV44_g3119 [Erysiphe necator]
MHGEDIDPYSSKDQSSSTFNIVMLPTNLWNLPYITHSPEILSAAIKIDPELVSHLLASSNSTQKLPDIDSNTPSPSPLPALRVTAPQITPYDGKSENLRSFCSQLVNQIEGCGEQFATEMSKVRFAYQCLGPGALLKMRSSFRCLEDPSVPAEITTLQGFLEALKQRCQDPGLEEKATRAVKILYQKKNSIS